MGYRFDEFAPGEIYHIFTRGVEKRVIFLSNKDKLRFLDLLTHSLPQGRIISYSMAKKYKHPIERTNNGEGLVDLLCYCLMDNHLHFLLRENTKNGISRYMQRLLNAYAKYFNMKQQRLGSLFIHPFKAVLMNGDDQFLHVARYIHLNPYVAHMIRNPFLYQWSSLQEYLSPSSDKKCHTAFLESLLKPEEHQRFMTDEADYARSLADLQHLLFDFEDK